MNKNTNIYIDKNGNNNDEILNNKELQEELLGKLWKTYDLDYDERKTMSDREYYLFILDDCPGDKYEYIIGKTEEGKYICISFLGIIILRIEIDFNNISNRQIGVLNSLNDLSKKEFKALNISYRQIDHTHCIAQYLRYLYDDNSDNDKDIISKHGGSDYNGMVGITREGYLIYISESSSYFTHKFLINSTFYRESKAYTLSGGLKDLSKDIQEFIEGEMSKKLKETQKGK